jgi:hypothetical protein
VAGQAHQASGASASMATTWLPVDTASGGTAAAAFFAQLAAKP